MSHQHDHDHSHDVVTPSVYQTLDELDFERGLWFAAQYGDLDRISKLLKRGTPVDSRDLAGYTALHYAALAGHSDVCHRLLVAGAFVDAKTRAGGATPLHRAAMAGRKEVLQILLNAGASCLTTDVDGRTALHRAAEGGHLAVAKMLLDMQPHLKDAKDNKGLLPVDFADCNEMISLLS